MTNNMQNIREFSLISQLKLIGKIAFLPGYNCTTVDCIAEFFNLKMDYLLKVIEDNKKCFKTSEIKLLDKKDIVLNCTWHTMDIHENNEDDVTIIDTIRIEDGKNKLFHPICIYKLAFILEKNMIAEILKKTIYWFCRNQEDLERIYYYDDEEQENTNQIEISNVVKHNYDFGDVDIRDELVKHTDVLSEVGELKTIPGIDLATTTDLINYFDVNRGAINFNLNKYLGEFKRDNFRTLKGREVIELVKNFNVKIENKAGYVMVGEHRLAQSNNNLFTRESVIRFAMLIKDSIVAAEICSKLNEREIKKNTLIF